MFRFCIVSVFLLAMFFSANQLSAQADIWMKDCDADVGNEPNNVVCGYLLWESVDIWNRTSPDPNHEPYPFMHSAAPTVPAHQNPVYRPLINAVPNYLYVRIRNRGDQPTTGTERLRVYWAKAGTGLDWPSDWVDNIDNVCGPDKLYGIEITKPRENAARVTQAERDAFIAAINEIKTNPAYRYSVTSSGSSPGVSWWDILDLKHQEPYGTPIHGQPGFLPWHRELNNRLELALRTANPLVRLLYWDYHDDINPRHMDGIAGTNSTSGGFNLLGPDFMGGDSTSPVAIGHPGFNDFQNLYYGSGGIAGTHWRNCGSNDDCWLLPPQLVRRGTPINNTASHTNVGWSNAGNSGLLDFAEYSRTSNTNNPADYGHSRRNESSVHNSLHTWHAGGSNIRSPSSTVEDPMFFVGIHIPVDKFWAMWQRDRLHLGNPDLGRIDPSCAYDNDGSHWSITDTLHPWDGQKVTSFTATGPTIGAANIAPWDNSPVFKTSSHPSVVYPPIYDDSPLTIPPLAPGECVIIEIPWYPPNPADYDCSALQNPKGHVCVLARIEEDENAPFGMTTPEVQSVWQNTHNNNNIAWKNMDVVTPSGVINGSVSEIILANPFDFAQRFDFELNPTGHIDLDDDEDRRRNVFNFGRVNLHLGDELFARWEKGGRIGMGGGEPRTVFEDDFNRGNGILAGWAHPGGATRSDRWQIERNRLVGTGSNQQGNETFTFAPVELPESFELNFNMSFIRGGSPNDGVGRHGGIMFCAQNRTSNRNRQSTYTLDWIDRRGVGDDSHGLRLGLNNNIIARGGQLLTDPPRNLRVVVNSDSIEVYGDGPEALIRSDDTALRGGNLGFWMYTTNQVMAFDNIRVTTLGGGETMVAIERQGVLTFFCQGEVRDWDPGAAPAIGIELQPGEKKMIAVGLELDEDYLERGRDILGERPVKFSLVQKNAENGQVLGGQTYVVDLSKLSLVAPGSDWRYISQPVPPREWPAPGLDDSEWAPLDKMRNYLEHGPGLARSANDPVFFLHRSSNEPYFFTHRFNLSESDINAIQDLWIRLKADDGGVVYLNGELIHRTPPFRAVTGLRENTFVPVNVTESIGRLRVGENLLAVAIGKHPDGNDQLLFDIELAANHINSDEPTVIAIQEPRDGAYFKVGDTIPISAEAIDPDGDSPNISYEVNGQPIRLVAGEQPSFTPTAPGMYQFRVGCSNNPATDTATIVVVDNLLPNTGLTLPGGTMYDEGEEIHLLAAVEDSDDVSVRFTAVLMRDWFEVSTPAEGADLTEGYGIQLGVDDTAPYEAVVDSLPPGHWAFLTFTLDERGGFAEGNMVMAHIMGTQPPPGRLQLPGDFNQNGNVDLSDAISVFAFLFLGGDNPGCPAAIDFNGDRQLDLSDGIGVLNWLFIGGAGHVLGTDCVEFEGCQSVCN